MSQTLEEASRVEIPDDFISNEYGSFSKDRSDERALWIKGAQFQAAREAKLVEQVEGLISILEHLERKFNNGQMLEPNGPNHRLIILTLMQHTKEQGNE